MALLDRCRLLLRYGFPGRRTEGVGSSGWMQNVTPTAFKPNALGAGLWDKSSIPCNTIYSLCDLGLVAQL